MFFFFFFNDTATTEIYTLSLHDALPISPALHVLDAGVTRADVDVELPGDGCAGTRSEEHTSELQSQSNLVCRLLLEKKKKETIYTYHDTQHESRIRCSHTIASVDTMYHL